MCQLFSCQSLLALHTQLIFLTPAEHVDLDALPSPNAIRLEFESCYICTAGAKSSEAPAINAWPSCCALPLTFTCVNFVGMPQMRALYLLYQSAAR